MFAADVFVRRVPFSVREVADEDSLEDISDAPKNDNDESQSSRDAHRSAGEYSNIEKEDAEFRRQTDDAEDGFEGKKKLNDVPLVDRRDKGRRCTKTHRVHKGPVVTNLRQLVAKTCSSP